MGNEDQKPAEKASCGTDSPASDCYNPESLDGQIREMGDSFRGLWRSYYIDWNCGEYFRDAWTVTFIYKGNYVETPNLMTPKAALNFAVEKLRDEREGL